MQSPIPMKLFETCTSMVSSIKHSSFAIDVTKSLGSDNFKKPSTILKEFRVTLFRGTVTHRHH